MDSFKEQIVRKIPTKNDKIQKIFIMIASVALAALCFIFPFGTQFSVIGIFLAAAALYGGYYLTTKLDVEYEYIFTNGEIDSPSVFFFPSRRETEISVIPALQEPTQCFSLVSAPAPTATVPTSSAMLRSDTKSFLYFFINMPPSKRYFYHNFYSNTPFRL